MNTPVLIQRIPHVTRSVPNSSQDNQNQRTSSEKILKRRESTFMMPTKQTTNRTRQKLAELQTKGMSPEQLRNYYRERSFLNSVARRGSLHDDADKRLLDGIGSNINSKTELPSSVEEESVKHGKQQQANQKNCSDLDEGWNHGAETRNNT